MIINQGKFHAELYTELIPYGWYSFNNQQSIGWYFCSIPEKQIISLTDEELNSLTVISEECQCCPCPPTPFPPKIISDPRSFITVSTLTDLLNLPETELVNGKLARVNRPNVDSGIQGVFLLLDEESNDYDTPKYFVYDSEWKNG